MPQLNELLPDPEILLSLEVEELAGYVLETLQTQNKIYPVNYSNLLNEQYPPNFLPKVKAAVMEAWGWLSAEALIAPDPNEQPGWSFVTRRGRKLKTAADLAELQKRSLLKKELLHPEILQTAYPLFLSGHYDPAVLQAFKEVEIRVKAICVSSKLDGVKLVRDAFRPASNNATGGVLTDDTLVQAEQEGLQQLFAGAVLWCRNPVGHRNVGIKATEAAQLLVFASYLLDTIDIRTNKADSVRE